MLEIIFIRHGQVESNWRGAYIGSTNKPMTVLGINQIKETAEKLKDIPFAAIYTSPLERTKYTADIIKEKNGARVILSEGLKEWDFGIFEDLTGEAILDKYPAEYKKWQENWWEYKIPKGESGKEVYLRNSAAIKEIISRHPDGGQICVVSHLCVMRNMFCSLLGFDPRQASRFFIKNGSINKIRIDEDNYAVMTALNA